MKMKSRGRTPRLEKASLTAYEACLTFYWLVPFLTDPYSASKAKLRILVSHKGQITPGDPRKRLKKRPATLGHGVVLRIRWLTGERRQSSRLGVRFRLL